MHRVFEPFFSTRDGCTGLGLAIAHSIARQHGGRIDVLSRAGRPAELAVLLPAAGAGQSEPGSPSEAGTSCAHHPRVLVMDDDPAIGTAVSKMLRHLEVEAVVTLDGEEAIVQYEAGRRQGRPYDAVILDLTVRIGLGGKDAAARILAQDPDARLVVASGYATNDVLAFYREHGFCARLAKPFRLADLKKALDACGVARSGVRT